MTASLSLALIVALVDQAPSPPGTKDTAEASAARLDFMKSDEATYSIHANDDQKTQYRLQAEPILRFTNPVGRSRDGAIFLWLGTQDRPEVVDQVNVTRVGRWAHQFTSLSPHPLVAE